MLPSWVQFNNATADEIHNIYGHDWARLIFEGYQKDIKVLEMLNKIKKETLFMKILGSYPSAILS